MKSGFYKLAGEQSYMGAAEALGFADVLRRHGLLSRRTVAQYVLPALYGGHETKEGSPAHAIFEEALYREVFVEMPGNRRVGVSDPAEEAVGQEAGHYLERILATACGDKKRGLPRFDGFYNGYSVDAFEEVRRLLGRAGRSYLGISERSARLTPSQQMVRAIVIEDGQDSPENGEPERASGPESVLVDMERLRWEVEAATRDVQRAAEDLKAPAADMAGAYRELSWPGRMTDMVSAEPVVAGYRSGKAGVPSDQRAV